MAKWVYLQDSCQDLLCNLAKVFSEFFNKLKEEEPNVHFWDPLLLVRGKLPLVAGLLSFH